MGSNVSTDADDDDLFPPADPNRFIAFNNALQLATVHSRTCVSCTRSRTKFCPEYDRLRNAANDVWRNWRPSKEIPF